MAKWEYCIDNWEDLVTSDNLLNSYGKSGWELIAVCDGLGIFKRPINQEKLISKDEFIAEEALKRVISRHSNKPYVTEIDEGLGW